MSGAQHTPGPWSVLNDEAIKIKAHDGTLATVTHLHLRGRRDTNQVEANARLIAACPTMFEYVERRAVSGDQEAIYILEAINAAR